MTTALPWNPALYDAKHGFVAKFGEALLELLAPQPGEHILDLGCGTGHLSHKIAERGAAVIGLDSSPDMIAAARKAYPDIEFQPSDATDFAFDRLFDAVFSNAALHWVKPPEAAVRCIARALRPGGRLVTEFGGKGNIATIADAVRSALRHVTGLDIPHSLYFPSISQYSALLEAHGLEVRAAWLFDRPTPLEGPGGMRNWLAMFGGGLLGDLALRGMAADELERATAIAERNLRKTNFHDGQWFADYRRIRLVAARQ
jgi:trans-aconitate methyltransferase